MYLMFFEITFFGYVEFVSQERAHFNKTFLAPLMNGLFQISLIILLLVILKNFIF